MIIESGQEPIYGSKTTRHCWRIRSWLFVLGDDAPAARSYLRIEGLFYQ
jgi:hypothetical protein